MKSMLDVLLVWAATLCALWGRDGGPAVQCRGGVSCVFPELYYDTASRTFFVPDRANAEPGVRLFDTCTIDNHPSCHFAVEKRARWAPPSAEFDGIHLVRRFYSYNIFHMLHDDWLGAWDLRHTYWPDLRLPGGIVAVDHYGYEKHDAMFGWLHGAFTLVPSNQNGQHIIRFTNVLVGSSKRLAWYQYGFSGVQGPIQGKPASRRASINAAVEHVLDRFDVSRPVDDVAVVLQRKTNRVILNERQVVDVISSLGYQVRVMSLENDSIEDLVQTIGRSKLLVGVHGSLLGLGLFLPRGSLLVEVFPWRVNPDKVTPFRTMQAIRENPYACIAIPDKEHSVAPSNQGMLSGIPWRHRRRILRPQSQFLLMKRCCSDPEWLFYVNHDCIIDCDELRSLLSKN